MSKQLKFKFKKTLKKAEFVHADLEYHQELVPEAKRLFSEAVQKMVAKLSAEDQQLLHQEAEKRRLLKAEALELKAQRTKSIPQLEEAIQDSVAESDCKALTTTNFTPEEPDPEEQKEKTKSTELKKLFYRIAEETHPDKVRASGFSDKEVLRLERKFKKALQAYEDNNWYILYSIAGELDIKVADPTQEQIDWLEDDIRNTFGGIAQVSNLVAWIWYIGDDIKKRLALKDYFQQAYGFNYPGL